MASVRDLDVLVGEGARMRAARWRGAVDLAASPQYTRGYTPYPKQAEFHAAKARHVFFGGAAGPGKSRAIREDIADFCQRHPGVRVLVLRRTYPQIRDSHIDKIRVEWLGLPGRYLAGEHIYVFLNGSRVIFGSCQYERDLDSYLGPEYDRIYFDELVTFTEAMYTRLNTRCRTMRRDVTPQLKSASNPGGIGHSWVKQKWVDGARDDHLFIPAKLDDHGDEEFKRQYRAELEKLPEKERKAFLDGNWDAFAGMFFDNFDRAIHIVKPFELPLTWQRVRGIDYGGISPFTCEWSAKDTGNERVYFYREHYHADKSLKWHCEEIVRRSAGERYRRTVADPSMFGKTQEEGRSRVSLASQAARYGLDLTSAVNARVDGAALFKQGLEPQSDGIPQVLFFEDACPELIREITTLCHDDVRVEDVNTKQSDHGYDGARYALQEQLGARKRTTPTAGASRDSAVASSGYGRR